jgi:glycosyltransferase involved in cell wall biosynthesis
MKIGVITPSYIRLKLLKRFLRRMPRQTYRDWRLVIVHDGPNADVERLVRSASERDSRIAYIHTDRRSNNYGVTPRTDGLRYMIREAQPDYCVFWDDDNLFRNDAIATIVTALEEAGRPDLLLVPIRYSGSVKPTPGVALEQLTWGDVDTGSIVVRPEAGLRSYERALETVDTEDPKYFYTQDARYFLYMRDQVPGLRISMARCRPIGLHDGLRTTVYIRSLLGLPELGIGPRLLKRDG